MDFKEFLRLYEFAVNLDSPISTVIPGTIPFGAIAAPNSGPSPSQDPAPIPPRRGEMKLGLPEITVTGIITSITGPGMQQHGEPEQDGRDKIIQITIKSDADQKSANLLMTWDQFKRIQGQPPAKGRKMSVVFQRHPGEQSSTPSQIQNATVY